VTERCRPLALGARPGADGIKPQRREKRTENDDGERRFKSGKERGCMADEAGKPVIYIKLYIFIDLPS